MTIIPTITVKIRIQEYRMEFLLTKAQTQAMEIVEVFQVNKMTKMDDIHRCMSTCNLVWTVWTWELVGFLRWIMLAISRSWSTQVRKYLYLKALCKGVQESLQAIFNSLTQMPYKINKNEVLLTILALRVMLFKIAEEAEIRSEELKMKHKK